MVLAEPVKRTITVVGVDGKPVAGLTLVPRSYVQGSLSYLWRYPRSGAERLAVTTDANGAATIPYFLADIEHAHGLVFGPGSRAYAAVAGTTGQGRLCAQVGPAWASGRNRPIRRRSALGRRLRSTSGCGRRVLRCGLGLGARPGASSRPPSGSLWFESRCAAGLDGKALSDAAELLSESTYRVSIRHEGFQPFVSDGSRWTANAWCPRSGSGASHARRLCSGSPGSGGCRRPASSWLPTDRQPATNAKGRFELAWWSNSEKTFILVNRPRFSVPGLAG